MSGSAKKDRRPINNAELVRDQERRIDSLETSDALRAGDWVISTQIDTGNLIASHKDGGSRVVVKVPEAGTDADAVTEDAEVPHTEAYQPPALLLTRGAKNILTTNDTIIDGWNAENEVGGPWSYDGTTVTIPEDGVYGVVLYWPWASNANGFRAAALYKNGTGLSASIDRDSQANTGAEMCNRIVNFFLFTKGDILRTVAWQNSGGTLSGGGPNFGTAGARWNIYKAQVPTPETGVPPDPTPIN